MTTHSAKGLEFNNVTIVIKDFKNYYSKELIYVALTRVKKKLYIWEDNENQNFHKLSL